MKGKRTFGTVRHDSTSVCVSKLKILKHLKQKTQLVQKVRTAREHCESPSILVTSQRPADLFCSTASFHASGFGLQHLATMFLS